MAIHVRLAFCPGRLVGHERVFFGLLVITNCELETGEESMRGIATLGKLLCLITGIWKFPDVELGNGKTGFCGGIAVSGFPCHADLFSKTTSSEQPFAPL
jgi:hypothetical protein